MNISMDAATSIKGKVEVMKVVVYVPVLHADVVRKALGDAGAGKLGNYEYCSFSVRGTGRFRPLKGAQPFIGKKDELARVEEERVETICPVENWESVVAAVKKAHPYEEPAIDVYPLFNRL